MSVPDRTAIAGFARSALLVACSITAVACAAGGGSAPPPTVSSAGPGVSADPSAAVDPGASIDPSPPTAPDSSVPSTEGAGAGSVPIACYGLGEADCRRVGAHVATLLPAGSPSVGYVQVGPFGCAVAQPCPTTLAARPEGDVVVEFAGGATAFHVKVDGDRLDAQPQEAFGVQLAPTTRPPLPAAAQPFTLGHCGLWSGIDLGGSWWDPVGFVDADHPDTINAASGTLVLVGPDRALFTSNGGLIVELMRRDGEKFLPLCQ
jgi:hypothetical protein